MLRLCWSLAAGDYCELKVRMGWTKNRLEKRIVIENHRFEHKNNVMLELKNGEKEKILIENRAG